MKAKPTFSELQSILARQLRKDTSVITLESKIKDDLGADSLDILQLLMKLEDDYGIEIPDEKLATFTIVNDIMQFIDSQS